MIKLNKNIESQSIVEKRAIVNMEERNRGTPKAKLLKPMKGIMLLRLIFEENHKMFNFQEYHNKMGYQILEKNIYRIALVLKLTAHALILIIHSML